MLLLVMRLFLSIRPRRLPAFPPSLLSSSSRPLPVFASYISATRLFATKKANKNESASSFVEISPSDHGTEQLTSLVDGALDERLERRLHAGGLSKPTPIQAHAIPLLLKGYDVMASAQTGSGKTYMFCLPLCHQLLTQRQAPSSPAAIVINPTRELAMQTANVLSNLTKSSKLKIALATGGASQQRQTVQSCDILVGTPGRILQFIDERVVSLRSTQQVVVDEADRMLDLGFEPQLKRIARSLGREQQNRTT
jgi:ATP-dependent RNA helicase RhlE